MAKKTVLIFMAPEMKSREDIGFEWPDKPQIRARHSSLKWNLISQTRIFFFGWMNEWENRIMAMDDEKLCLIENI